MSIVTVSGLTKHYPTFTLDNISFTLNDGRIAGFIGRNGAGKTTVIKSMLNLVHPDSGEITYFDKPLIDNEAEIKSRIGYSTGNISWYPRKKIRDIVAVESKFYKNWDEMAYRKYLSLFHINESKTPMQLSEGMKVKCNLLLALSHGAELFILDEPTSGLDPFSRDELLEIFTALKNQGTAIFFSTHIISEIEKCADDILYISDGHLIANLPKSEFIEKYAENGESLEDTFLRLERGVCHA